MNQRSRQAVTNSVKKDFFKLLNNVNFGCGSISKFLILKTITINSYLHSVLPTMGEVF